MIPPPANQSRSPPGVGVILKQGISKEEVTKKTCSIRSPAAAGAGNSLCLHCLAQPPGQTLMLTQHILMRVCVCAQANQNPPLPPSVSPPFLLRSRMHASPPGKGRRGDAADAPRAKPSRHARNKSFLCPTGFLPGGVAPSTLCPPREPPWSICAVLL